MSASFLSRYGGFGPVTALLLAANVGVFVVQLAAGVSATAPSTMDLIRWGGNVAALTLTGESWRLVSSLFLHVGIIHLLFNMYMLAVWGPFLERHFGRTDFSLVYLYAGVAGSLTSAAWHGHHRVMGPTGIFTRFEPELQLVVSAGASGALMGIAGAWLATRLHHAIRRDGAPPRGVSTGNVVLLIGLNLVFGFMQPGIDNAAHLGGLAAGLLLGGLLTQVAGAGDAVRRSVRAVLIAFGLGAALYGLPPSLASEDLREMSRQLHAELQREQDGTP